MSAPLREPEAEVEGFNAFRIGADPDDNPYHFGTMAYEAWLAGWDKAYGVEVCDELPHAS